MSGGRGKIERPTLGRRRFFVVALFSVVINFKRTRVGGEADDDGALLGADDDGARAVGLYESWEADRTRRGRKGVRDRERKRGLIARGRRNLFLPSSTSRFFVPPFYRFECAQAWRFSLLFSTGRVYLDVISSLVDAKKKTSAGIGTRNAAL